jgi:hypothetical protein
MTDILCRCGSPKSHHLMEFTAILGTKISDETFVMLKEMYKTQLSKYSCGCLEYKQDNLSYLEAKATEKGL